MTGLTSVALSATIIWNIYEAEQKETILGWWLWKRCIQITENLIPKILRELWKSSMLSVGYHSFIKSGQRIIFFWLHISLQDWIQQHQLVIRHRLNELISILRYFCNKYFIYFLTFFYFIYFYLVNISYPVTCLKLFNTSSHQRS